jgi:hypothetical protein
MLALLDAFDARGVEAHGVAFPTGSAHLSIAGEPDLVAELLGRLTDAVNQTGAAEEER